MKHTAQRHWQVNRPARKARLPFDQTTALGSLTVALLAYIVYHIVHPLMAQGLLW
ncbi:hypothetical protein [Spirosoma areae]